VDHLHASAERLEHVTDASMRSDLARATDKPRMDPQGREIP
jgi:Mn-dependent DtxR family transcriptional regulator